MENITKKEIWIGVAVVLVVLALAVFFEPFIKDGMMKEIRLYQDALRIDNDAKMFSYAQKTNVGNVLAYGDIEALQPQKIDDLLQSYMTISKIKEHYTRHTRQVSHQSCSGSGTKRTCTTYYTTEVYYTWDTTQQWNYVSPNYRFLDVEFQYGQLQLPNGSHLKLDATTINQKYVGFYNEWYLYENSSWGQPSGNDRYYFNILPTKFATSLFVKFLNGQTINPISNGSNFPVLTSQTPDQIIQQKKDNLILFDWVYFILIGLAASGSWIFLAYQYLEIE